jgi:hypothetical protein
VEADTIHFSSEIDMWNMCFWEGMKMREVRAQEECVDVNEVLSPGSLFVRVRRATWSN